MTLFVRRATTHVRQHPRTWPCPDIVAAAPIALGSFSPPTEALRATQLDDIAREPCRTAMMLSIMPLTVPLTLSTPVVGFFPSHVGGQLWRCHGSNRPRFPGCKRPSRHPLDRWRRVPCPTSPRHRSPPTSSPTAVRRHSNAGVRPLLASLSACLPAAQMPKARFTSCPQPQLAIGGGDRSAEIYGCPSGTHY